MAVDINTTLENIKTSQDALSVNVDALALSIDQLNVAVIQVIEECCKAQRAGASSDTDDPPSDGTVSVGEPGDQFGSQEEYLDDKCLASNALFDTFRNIVQALYVGDIPGLVAYGTGTTGAINSIMSSVGPLSWTITKVNEIIVSLAVLVISTTVNFDDIRDALDDEKAALINDLYQSSDTVSARSTFLATLATATPTLTASELSFAGFLLTHKALNQLFEPGTDTLTYTPPSPTVCTSALWTVAQGTPTTPLTGTSITVNSAWGSLSPFVPAHHGARMYIPPGLGDRTTDLTALTGWSTNPYGSPTLSDSGYINESGVWTFADGDPLVFIDDVCVKDGQYVDIASSTPFTVTIEYKTACP